MTRSLMTRESTQIYTQKSYVTYSILENLIFRVKRRTLSQTPQTKPLRIQVAREKTRIYDFTKS